MRSPCATHSPISPPQPQRSLKVVTTCSSTGTQNLLTSSRPARFGLVPVYDERNSQLRHQHRQDSVHLATRRPPCSRGRRRGRADPPSPACPRSLTGLTLASGLVTHMETRATAGWLTGHPNAYRSWGRASSRDRRIQMVTSDGALPGLSPTGSLLVRTTILHSRHNAGDVLATGLPLTTVHDARRSVRTINRILVANRGESLCACAARPPAWAHC